MIILDAQTKTLEIFLGGAVATNQLPVVATYVDVTTTAFAPGSSDADTNSTTDVTIVAAPGASTQRQVKFISVKNEDTAAATVTIQLNNNGTDRVIVEITLAVNSTLIYTDGEGFRVIDSGGNIKTVTSYGLHASSHTDGTDNIQDTSTSQKGIAELAVASEINAGDDTGRTISPKELSDSNYGKRIMYIKVLASDTALETGDGQAYITIPIELSGMNLVLAHAAVYTKSSSGLPEVSLERSVDQGDNWTDMLSTAITIDENEWSSYTATTAPVIDGAQDDVATGYWIRVNVDAAGTGTKGLDIILTAQLP